MAWVGNIFYFHDTLIILEKISWTYLDGQKHKPCESILVNDLIGQPLNEPLYPHRQSQKHFITRNSVTTLHDITV